MKISWPSQSALSRHSATDLVEEDGKELGGIAKLVCGAASFLVRRRVCFLKASYTRIGIST